MTYVLDTRLLSQPLTLSRPRDERAAGSVVPFRAGYGARVSTSRPALRLLGPLELEIDGRRVEPATGRLRALLTALAVAGERGASVEDLALALWPDEEPAHPRRSLQTYVVRLRQVLGRDAIATTAHGYALRLGDDEVDVRRFERTLDRAGELAGAPDERAALEQALSLWRGVPFDDVVTPGLQAERDRLTERYAGALERRIRLDLEAGRQAELLPQLRELTARHPLREPLWALLLTALERSGRRAEALEQYERVRSRIADELGADPGPQLRAVHTALLRERPAHDRDVAPPVPHQLPPAAPGFVGRDEALAELDRRLVPDGDPPACVAITGTAGVGKTALAVQWARRTAAGRFPDGQLFLDLRGFAPCRRPLEPEDAVRTLLEALQVPAVRIPATADAQLGLYRSLLAGRRMLVVLDNALDAAQVRPLLPGSPGSAALVTSRRRLTGLNATAGAHLLALDLPSAEEARRLLLGRLDARVTEDVEPAVDELVEACARLPLALTVVAARINTTPGSPRTVAADLRVARTRLDVLADDDQAIDLRSVFSWSYAGLGSAAASLFRRAGQAPGADLDVPAAAALGGVGRMEAGGLLGELTRAHLVVERRPGRFSLHDLLREYAAELAADDDPAEVAAAADRLVEHRTRSAVAAVTTFRPTHEAPRLSANPAVDGHVFGSEAETLAWFDTERDALLATVESAATTGPAGIAWELATAVMVLLDRRGRWPDAAHLARTCLRIADRLGDDGLRAAAHRWLGRALGRLGRPEDALAELRAALELWARAGDRPSQARALRSIAIILEDLGRADEVLEHNREALALFRTAGDRPGEADALNAVGWAHVLRGEYEQALVCCREALELVTALDDTFYRAVTWDSMAAAHRGLRDWPAAVEAYEQAAGLFASTGAFYDQAVSLTSLADCLDDAGDGDGAAAARVRAAAAQARVDQPQAP